MPARVTLLGPLRELAGTQATTSEADSAAALLDELGGRYGDDFRRQARKARILVNGGPIQFGRGVRTRLSDGDEVALVFPVGGG